MLQETGTYFTQVRLFLVELLLKAFEELLLEAVDLLDVAKNGSELIFSEHICPLAALFYVTLQESSTVVEKLSMLLWVLLYLIVIIY